MPESLLQYSCRPQASSFIKKETLAQVFPCEFREISKNNFLRRREFHGNVNLELIFQIKDMDNSNDIPLQTYLNNSQNK